MLNDELTGRQNKKEEIFNKWNSPIFDSYTNPWEKYDLALILENQKLYNEDLSDLPFKQISVPLICKIWKQLSLNDWISVQSMFGVKDYIYYIDDHEMKKEEVSAKEHNHKVVWAYDEKHNNHHETEILLAQEIIRELQRMVLSDIRNNAKTVSTWDFNAALGNTIREKYENLYTKINTVKTHMIEKYNKEPVWIVTSPEISSVLETI